MKYANSKNITSRDDYLEPYQSSSATERKEKSEIDKEKIKNALRQAHANRDFEINLYWERTKYFGAFITLAFTGYFFMFPTTMGSPAQKNTLLLIVSALGLFASVCWFLVNKASKYWQENWEHHIALLEDEIMGPLYKTTTDQKLKFSVSKINQLLSFVVMVPWIVFFLIHICQAELIEICITIAVVIIFLAFVIFDCRTKDREKTKFSMTRLEIKLKSDD